MRYPIAVVLALILRFHHAGSLLLPGISLLFFFSRSRCERVARTTNRLQVLRVVRLSLDLFSEAAYVNVKVPTPA